MKCKKCGNTFSEARWKLGISLCFECGEKIASEEIKRKMGRTAIAYNKGPIMYMGSEEKARANLIGTMDSQGRRQVTDGIPVITSPFPAAPTAIKSSIIKQKQIGLVWVNGDPMPIFNKEDPRLKKYKHVFYNVRG